MRAPYPSRYTHTRFPGNQTARRPGGVIRCGMADTLEISHCRYSNSSKKWTLYPVAPRPSNTAPFPDLPPGAGWLYGGRASDSGLLPLASSSRFSWRLWARSSHLDSQPEANLSFGRWHRAILAGGPKRLTSRRTKGRICSALGRGLAQSGAPGPFPPMSVPSGWFQLPRSGHGASGRT